LFEPIIEKLEELSGKKYENNKKDFRIIADHIRGSVFLAADGVVPSNTERGYILRRILRRAIRFGKLLDLKKSFLIDLIQIIIDKYKNVYPELENNDILDIIKQEQEKFEKTLEIGITETTSVLTRGDIDAKKAFELYSSYGFPLEMIEELAEEKNRKVDRKGFQKEFEKHQEISRAGARQKFKGGLVDTSEQTTKYHTATHLLLAALRKVLNKNIQQKGSNITAERLRFDFSHNAKLTEEEIKKVEDLVNQKIKEDLEVRFEEIPLNQARKEGAVGVFGEKYGEVVKVYTIGDFSKEICGGPHVKRTSELGHFKITKQKSPGAGARRIRAILE
jgi:alanyl-tRNA synthetase